METWLPIIIQLISGAVGGNAAGAAMKDQSLGTVGNSIAGMIGGGLGGQILALLGVIAAAGAGSMDTAGVAGSVATGGAGGGALMAIVGIIKKALNKEGTE